MFALANVERSVAFLDILNFTIIALLQSILWKVLNSQFVCVLLKTEEPMTALQQIMTEFDEHGEHLS